MSLGPNDTMQCPSRARLKSHRAHGVTCLTCEPDAEWAGVCPCCRRPVLVVGRAVQPHRDGRWFACAGTAMEVEPPPAVERPVWLAGMPREAVVRVPVRGGAA